MSNESHEGVANPPSPNRRRGLRRGIAAATAAVALAAATPLLINSGGESKAQTTPEAATETIPTDKALELIDSEVSALVQESGVLERGTKELLDLDSGPDATRYTLDLPHGEGGSITAEVDATGNLLGVTLDATSFNDRYTVRTHGDTDGQLAQASLHMDTVGDGMLTETLTRNGVGSMNNGDNTVSAAEFGGFDDAFQAMRHVLEQDARFGGES